MSTDEELPAAETETTSKYISSTIQNLTQNTATNEPETGSTPGSDLSLLQVEDVTSKNRALPTNKGENKLEEDDTETSKHGSALYEIKPVENETSKDSDNTIQAEETSKQDPDDVENINKDASLPSAEDDNISEISSPPAQASLPSAEDDNISKISSPPAQASSVDKQEAGNTKTSGQDYEPSVQEIPPAYESASKNPVPPEVNVSQASIIRSQETEDTLASRRDSATSVDPQPIDTTPIENAAIPMESSPPEDDDTRSMQTRNQEIDHTDIIEDHPHEQDATQSENEATGRLASSPNNTPMQSIATGTPEEVPNQETVTRDADSRPPVNEISPDENMNTVKHSSSFPNNFSNHADSRQKKSSFWKKFRWLFFKSNKKSSPKSSGDSTTTKSDNSVTSLPNDKESSSKSLGDSTTIKSITSPSVDKTLPNLIEADINFVREETLALKDFNDRLSKLNDDAQEELEANVGNHGELRKSMIKLKLLIPSQRDVNSDVFKALQSRLKSRESIPQDLLKRMPQLHKNENFYCSQEIKDFKVLYQRLERKLKLCLLCFSIFPGNETIRKRLMVRWWLTEGLSNEEEAENHFDKLREEGFIVPVNNNRSLYIGRYRMHPLYQSMLKMLAEKAKFFNFDDKGKPTQNYANSFQACLVGEGLLSYGDLEKKLVTIDGLEKIHLLMNVEESILDFKPHWFAMMRNVNVLYLGRWQASDAAHIEVEETKFLDELKNTNSVKFLSLQGISNIITLTDSILNLKRLECLDLRACHNLKSIPSGIGLLTRLTHLDMSQCYLLDHMPKSLSKLINLRVFKGFVVSHKKDSCTVDDLKEMKELTKLCIYTTSKHFPEERDAKCLGEIEKLVKLSIAWGGEALKEEKKDDTSNPGVQAGTERDSSEQDLYCFQCITHILSAPALGGETSKAKLERVTSNPARDAIKDGIEKEPSKRFSKLEKLDLKCFPMKATPSWLKAESLEQLKKLYIRGGRFSDIGQYQCVDHSHISLQKKNVWKVKVLRLRYLSNLEMEWRQLHELFPDLVYLEHVSCPKLTLFNCGAGGVWISQTRLKAWEKPQVSAKKDVQPSEKSVNA